MRSNKYKFRISRYGENYTQIAIYNQRRDRPLVVSGTVDEDGLFSIGGTNTPHVTARQYIADGCKLFNEKECDYISGSIKNIDRDMQQIILELSQNSFRYRKPGEPVRAEYWSTSTSKFKNDESRLLNPMLLIEYIKKNGKFYGKQDKIFLGRAQGSQD